MSLPEFSVKHSVFGNMLTLFVIIGGLVMLTFLQRDTFPEIELDLVVVTTRYPGASPEEIESLVTNPLEEKIKEVEDIKEYASSSVEGISVITIQIDEEARYKERVINEIQRKVDQVTELPSEAEDPEVESIVAQGPSIRVVITGPVAEAELRRYGDRLKRWLEGISGVSSVEKGGWRDEEFWVEADLRKLVQQELSMREIANALANQNVNLPGGKMPEGEREVVLRTLGQFHSVEEIRNVVVRSNSDGNHIRVGDIADVTRTYAEDVLFAKANGTRAVVLGVKKKRSGDTIDIADAVKAMLVEAQAEAPEGISLFYVDDESYYVKRRLSVLSSNGLIGIIMVVVILFLFLNFRVALVTGIGIPFAFLAALMIMSGLGITINLMTMFGLIIVLGMVVDDAIIVGENIFRHMEEGADPRTAAIEGTNEVMYPVVATVLTTMAAFAPLAFAPDVIGQVLRWLPITVAITLFASLLESLVVLPCHVVDFVPPLRGDRRSLHDDKGSGHPVMDRVMAFYTSQIRRALRLRWVFLPVVLAVFVGLVALSMKLVRVDIFPADLIDIFKVSVAAKQGTRLEVTERIMGEVEDRIGALPDGELQDVLTYVGGHISPEQGFTARGTHYASALVYLTPQNTRERKTQVVIDELRKACRDIEGIEKVEFSMIEPGPPTGKPLEVKIRGPDFGTLNTISDKIMAFLSSYGGVTDIQSDYEPGKDELHIRVDKAEAARLGLDTATIAQTVFTAYQGAEATVVREGDEELKVRVKLQPEYRDDPTSLELLTVANRAGRPIPLTRVVDMERERGLPAVYHYEGDRVVTVSASFEEDVSSVEVNRALEKAFAGLPIEFPGYDLIRGGEWKETRKFMLFMLKAFGMAMLLIYLILAVQFNSMLQPFVVMAAIPLGMIGVVLALIAHSKPVSIMAAMGMVGMAGVVVNDAIVLVKFVNDRRINGERSVTEAVVLAGQKRLRPILLTSVTTIAGLMPVIYGWGGYEPFVAPAAITLAYGLLFATFLTLMVVPATYRAAVDVKRGFARVGGFAKRLVGR